MRLGVFLCLLLLSQVSLAQTLKIQLTGLGNLKSPGEVVFEATSALPWCHDLGPTPLPYYSPKVLKVAPKISMISRDHGVIEFSLAKLKSNNCTYAFKSFTIWAKKASGFLSIERAEKYNVESKDFERLEIRRNIGARYDQICSIDSGLYRCQISRDGILLGHGKGNGARLFLETKDLQRQDSIETEVTLKLNDR
jgi:hypothetical protein